MHLIGNNGSNTLEGGAGADLIYGFDPNGPQGNVSSIAATRVAAGLSQPIFAVAPPDDLGRLFIVEKTGLIKILDLGTRKVLPAAFLDLSLQIETDGEQGLLGLAFDPDYAQNGYFYVNLINTNGDTQIRRYQVSSTDPNRASAASATPVITIDQPAGHTNHKAGWIAFGADGYLYAALGDGGSAGDPFNNAQNMNSLLGKMLRLDVDGDDFPGDASRNYAIPAGNPFAAIAGADEIWALGLRNPWRPSFDRGLGDLYIADVGQNVWEEIDLGQAGANYGWDLREGPDPFAGGSVPAPVPFTDPIYSYQQAGSQSITGGYVYRGTSEGLHGQYFFGDFISGKIFTLRQVGGSWVATERTAQIAPDAGSVGSPSSFAQDGSGNLYVIDFGGEVFRLTPNVTSADQGDVLLGNDGNDMLFGGSGADTLDGGDGKDELQGGRGNDTLDGGSGSDRMGGGTGNDTYYVNSAADVVTEAAGAGTDLVRASVSYTLAANVENLLLPGSRGISGIGNSGKNTLTGNSGNNTLLGEAGSDTLNGNAGSDTLYGNSGNDTLSGNAANDTLGGGTGVDTLNGGAGNDTLLWRADDASINGGTGLDTLRVDGAHKTLDLTAIANSKIKNVEVIRLNGADITLRLEMPDVLAISTESNTLRVAGTRDDTAEIGTGWTRGASQAISGNIYHSYTQNLATLLVDSDIAIQDQVMSLSLVMR